MRNNVLICFLFTFHAAMAQFPAIPIDLPRYGFIQYNANQFELIQDNHYYTDLFTKFDDLIKTGDTRINIVHIGGSHIQADIYTHRVRQDMQSFYPGILGSRGFFFPYPIAQTNSPSNLWITYSGEWKTSKNTQPNPDLPLGLSGITSELISDTGSLKIVARYDTLQHYDFNRIRIFCNVSLMEDLPTLYPGPLVENVMINEHGGYVEYTLSQYTDTLHLLIQQTDTAREPFQLYGISLDNDDPGVAYNSIGVNGAMLKSYLRCGLFSRQLQALEPDWIIVSIGTNEGNSRSFDKEAYRGEYLQLLDSLKRAVPDAAILLTVPNDSYLHKRYVNPNTARIREVIFDIARSHGCGVWDFYSVMGGLNSAMAWYNSGLMNNDHIHFSRPGYLLKGDLFFSAFLTSWDKHLLHPLTKIQTPKPTPIFHTSSIQSPIPTPISHPSGFHNPVYLPARQASGIR